MAQKKPRERVQIDIADMLAKIDAYPEAAGIDPVMWNELSYSQKLRYLLKKQLEIVDKNLDELSGQ